MISINKPKFREDKAVAIIASFLKLTEGRCDKYWLNKVMYYVERQSLIFAGQPMFFDELYSAPYGPIVSNVNDGIDLSEYPSTSTWSTHFRLTDKTISLETEPDLSVLSDFEIDLIKSTSEKFKDKSFNEMHEIFRNLPEHMETKSRVPIQYETILAAEGFTQDNIKDTIEELSYIHYLESTLSCEV